MHKKVIALVLAVFACNTWATEKTSQLILGYSEPSDPLKVYNLQFCAHPKEKDKSPTVLVEKKIENGWPYHVTRHTIEKFEYSLYSHLEVRLTDLQTETVVNIKNGYNIPVNEDDNENIIQKLFVKIDELVAETFYHPAKESIPKMLEIGNPAPTEFDKVYSVTYTACSKSDYQKAKILKKFERIERKELGGSYDAIVEFKHRDFDYIKVRVKEIQFDKLNLYKSNEDKIVSVDTVRNADVSIKVINEKGNKVTKYLKRIDFDFDDFSLITHYEKLGEIEDYTLS